MPEAKAKRTRRVRKAKIVTEPVAITEPVTVEAQDRTLRSAETREKETRRKPWSPPAMLDTPKPPPGMHYRWIRAEMMGQMDKLNMGKRFREGYVPVKPEEVEEQGYELPTIEDGKHAGVIGVGGLILAKIPLETANERKAYYKAQTRNQMNAIDTELAKNSHVHMPMKAPQRESHTTFGNPENKPDPE